MASIASSSRLTRSSTTRTPLLPLPIMSSIQFQSSSTLPSPVSLPTKRGFVSSEPSSSGGSKARKVSRAEKDGSETIRKTRSSSRKGKERQVKDDDNDEEVEIGVTPKIRNVLNTDDLGTGKSPARRLFVNGNTQRESPISGISGAISTPPKYHRGLAPSPPFSDSPSNPASTSHSTYMTGIEIDVQSAPSPELLPTAVLETDCGFEIYESTQEEMREMDEQSASIIMQRGPSISRSNSPALSEVEQNMMYNQENIQPLPSISYPPSPISKSRSNRSTPSKYSTTDDEEIISMYLNAPSYSPSTISSISGSGTRRRERSKLINEVLLLRGENIMGSKRDEVMDVDEKEELTPGRTVIRGGRERLAREVNMA
ncbi:uncharacterized protein I206_101053 [Kwoniella pini CBS 10737]|uniref:Uncharacterized protein n=1 Tax=Kwoniella pini CBS 10737 TaxID=1296096 RepID=A0A1B9IBE2_9TREE|nr:uncharacterized protein I206_00273 [Kwoniella pini CBS 10737]OCF52972.1 hypothetical protein I206_00273 [Kwoniella pini CBS 10737]